MPADLTINVCNTTKTSYNVCVAHKLRTPRNPIEPVYVQLGHRVATERRSARLTQGALAERTGVGRPTLANIEKGRQRVMYHQLLSIADALDLDPSELLPPRPKDTESLRRLDALDSSPDVLDWARRGLARTDGENGVIGS
jgi:transcriptional regulator with XRE-family HTH domain